MEQLWDIKTIKKILERNNFNFSKSLGQNFLIDKTVCPKMAQYALPDSGFSAIEIGPGIGILTKELALRAKKVVCVEIDKRLLKVLDETLGDFDNIEIINGDILKIDIDSLIEEKFNAEEIVVCANLPYYITSPVIMYFLENKAPVKSLTLMVQKEAADRLCAQVGSRQSGAVTVAVNYYAQATKLFDVSRQSFLPQPNVDSSVINLKIRKKPPIKVTDEKLFFSLVKAAFSQRRKTAVNSISSGLGLEKSAVACILEKAGVDKNARAENLSMENFEFICNELKRSEIKCTKTK